MNKKYSISIIFALFLINIFCYYIIFNFLFLKDEVAFLNVGQGDSELIRTKAGNILIDAGPNNQILFEISKILPFYDRIIDLVIISHPNTDHFNGLFSLLEHYKIRAVMINNLDYPASRYQNLLKQLKINNVLFLKGENGTKIKWDNNFISIISPLNSNTNVNNSSLVALLNLNQKQFLFTGDIESSVEKKIIKYFNQPIDVLKVPHHGSQTASSEEFLNTLKPKIAVIEVGENNYGQPHPDTLKRLNAVGAQIFRTDLDGTIQFIFDNNIYQIKKESL
jgi:competence protein ComEC